MNIKQSQPKQLKQNDERFFKGEFSFQNAINNQNDDLSYSSNAENRQYEHNLGTLSNNSQNNLNHELKQNLLYSKKDTHRYSSQSLYNSIRIQNLSKPQHNNQTQAQNNQQQPNKSGESQNRSITDHNEYVHYEQRAYLQQIQPQYIDQNECEREQEQFSKHANSKTSKATTQTQMVSSVQGQINKVQIQNILREKMIEQLQKINQNGSNGTQESSPLEQSFLNTKKIENMIGQILKQKNNEQNNKPPPYQIDNIQFDDQDLDNAQFQLNNQDIDMLQEYNHTTNISKQDQNTMQIAQKIKMNLSKYKIEMSICAIYNQLTSSASQILDNDQNSNNSQNFYQRSSLIRSRHPRQSKPIMRIEKGKHGVRQSLQRQIAYIFVNKGYGLHITKQQTGQQIDGNKYNSILTSIIRNTMRKLCDIMTRNLGQAVKNFDSNDERYLRSPLVNCRKWLTPNQQKTFFKIINLVYSLQQEPIYQDQIVILYDKIMKQLHKRSTNKINEQSDKNKNIKSVSLPLSLGIRKPPPSIIIGNNGQPNINTQPQMFAPPKYQKQIVQLFIRFKNPEAVFTILNGKYRQFCWTPDIIRASIQKLVKISLQKALKLRQQLVQKVGKAPALVISTEMAKNICCVPGALDLRITILKFLLESTMTPSKLISLINSVNAYITAQNRINHLKSQSK